MRLWLLFLAFPVLSLVVCVPPCFSQQAKVAESPEQMRAGVRPQGTFVRPQGGVQRPDLGNAWAAYEVAVSKATEGLTDAIKRQFDSATKKGDLNAALKFDGMLTDFQKRGILPPDANPKNSISFAKDKFDNANDDLVKQYDSIVKALTVAQQLPEAQQVAAEKTRIQQQLNAAGASGVPPVLPLPPMRPKPLTVPFDSKQAVAAQNQWAMFLGIPVSSKNSAGITLVLIPPGVFEMEEGGRKIQVTITKPFCVGQTEITRAQWKEVMGNELWGKKVGAADGDDVAATGMTWDQAVDFCRKLTAAEAGPKNLKPYGPYRLPTEAEWEYAARAGANTRWSFGDNDKEIGEHAWTLEECRAKNEKYVHAVALKKANAWSLYDVHGNVFEWCDDWFSALAAGPLTDPKGPAAGNLKVNRGGGFGNPRGLASFDFRNRHAPHQGMDFKGFRIAAGISEKP